MNKYELICWYCDFSWQTNHIIASNLYCSQCKDTNIKVVDLHRTKIDTYGGSPPFEKKEDKKDWDLKAMYLWLKR